MIRPLTILAFGLSLLRADVTIRYKTEVKNSLQAINPLAGSQLNSVIPPNATVRIKGARSYNEFGIVTSIGDSDAKELIVLDTAAKIYIITDNDEYLAGVAKALPAVPANVAQMAASFKTSIESKITGRTATIQGIEAQERQVIMAMEMPGLPNVPAGPTLRMVMEIWTATEAEATRVPALREWAAFIGRSSLSPWNPATGLKKLFEAIPGTGDAVASLIKEMATPGSVTLRMHFSLFMPMLGEMVKQLPPGSNPFGPNFDPNAAIVQVTQEVVELSTARIPDTQFQVPEGYKQVPIEDFMKQYLARLTPAK